MKILVGVHQFLPDFTTGTEILAFQTARQLRGMGHQVTVFTGWPTADRRMSGRFDEYTHQGLRVLRYYRLRGARLGNRDALEQEYNDPVVYDFLLGYLRESTTEVVHFFHLHRLTGAAVDACQAAGVPAALTVTDFWSICPTVQLTLPDGRPCPGPTASAGNCVRHLAALTQPRWLVGLLNGTPDWLLNPALRILDAKVFQGLGGVGQVRAVRARAGYLGERLNRLTRVVVPTRLTEGVLRANGLDPERILYSPYGIDMNGLKRGARDRVGRPLRFGFIGTLREHKGAHVLVQAIRCLPGELPVEVRIYGDESEATAYIAGLRDTAAGDSRIQWRGTFPNAGLGEVLDGLDVLVVPSVWYENAPLVVYAAQAAGCPVVGSDVAGLAEVIRDGDNGRLFATGDPAALADVMRALVHAPDEVLAMSSRAVVPRSIESYARGMYGMYIDMLGKSAAR